MNDRLVLLTTPGKVMSERDLLLELLDEGLPCLHYRKTDHTEQQYKNWLDKIPKRYRDRVVIHQHAKLADKYELAGVHFKSTDQLENVSISRGQSVHSLAEIKGDVDRYYLSPIFPSFSKPGYGGSFDLKEVEKFLKETERNYKIFALGGIDVENAKKALALGFDGVVAMTYVWEEIFWHKLKDKVQRLMEITAL